MLLLLWYIMTMDTKTNQGGGTMNQEIWNWLHDDQRLNLIIKCGWINRSGQMTPTGRRIYRSTWTNLSDAARNVITKKYQEVA